MERLTIDKLRALIDLEPGEFHLEEFRRKHAIDPESSTFYVGIKRLLEAGELKRVGRGIYRRVNRAKPIKVFGREVRPPFDLRSPQTADTSEPLPFWSSIVFREGDCLLISGVKNTGKTAFCINLLASNLHLHPVLMGNEFTIVAGGEDGHEPSARFVERLKRMDWVKWCDDCGNERFDLLPVYRDYAEQIVPNKLNIIDWVNLPGEYYMISPLMEQMKRAVGRGLLVVVLQKGAGAEHGRGGAMSRDFADVEILIDNYGDDPRDVLLVLGTVKESTSPVMGKRYVYRIEQGVKITEFREVIRCTQCRGFGKYRGSKCDLCCGTGWQDLEVRLEA